MEIFFRKFPGIKEHIRFIETASPLTQEYYTNATNGAVCGVDLEHRHSITSKIRGLYFAGSNTIYGSGVVGAMCSGVCAASLILGKNLFTD